MTERPDHEKRYNGDCRRSWSAIARTPIRWDWPNHPIGATSPDLGAKRPAGTLPTGRLEHPAQTAGPSCVCGLVKIIQPWLSRVVGTSVVIQREEVCTQLGWR